MAKFVPDVKTQRWIIIAPERRRRPAELNGKVQTKPVSFRHGYNYSSDCPFCQGNEDQTPPELFRISKNHTEGSEWLVRVVPNKFPITDIHEVIVHSPDHLNDLVEFSFDHAYVIFQVYRRRYQILSSEGHVIIFNNKGPASGESLVHPHSQVVIIPRQIKLDVLPLEPVRNVVLENDLFITYCPDFSQWPYEVWVAQKSCFEKKDHECIFGKFDDEKLKDLTKICQGVLRRLNRLFPNFSYNYYLSPYACWYLRIIPRLTERAGFELGTGLHVNFIDPARVAEELIEVKGEEEKISRV